MGVGGKRKTDRRKPSPAALAAILVSPTYSLRSHSLRSHSLLAYPTVMGPDNKGGAQDRPSLVSRKPKEAPPLYPGADRFRWRRQVPAWVSYIQRRADAGETLCKWHAATISDLLYAAAHPSYQKVLELAKSASLDFSVLTEKQPDVVQYIVRLIGFETPIEATSRLLAAYKAVHACIRYSNEMLEIFTVIYRGVVSNYMDLANVFCNRPRFQTPRFGSS
jgi:hypothetical protein